MTFKIANIIKKITQVGPVCWTVCLLELAFSLLLNTLILFLKRISQHANRDAFERKASYFKADRKGKMNQMYCKNTGHIQSCSKQF